MAERAATAKPAMDGLVCLHGFTGRGSVWRSVLRECASDAERPTWCPDLLGHGPRARGRRLTSFEDEVERLAGGVHRRGWRRALVVGYSLGARLALGLLARHPRRCAGAVLIGVRAGISDDAKRRERRAQDSALAELVRREGVAAFVRRWQMLPLFASQQNLPPALRARHHRRRTSHTAEGLARSLEVLGLGEMPDYHPVLERIEQPIRLLVGALDDRFVDVAKNLAQRLPRARLSVVPASGHDLVLEAPRAVAAAIDEEWN